jgi:hypothetical protein
MWLAVEFEGKAWVRGLGAEARSVAVAFLMGFKFGMVMYRKDVYWPCVVLRVTDQKAMGLWIVCVLVAFPKDYTMSIAVHLHILFGRVKDGE